jgi:glycosyltransferase involved in cell wall biosynthesis
VRAILLSKALLVPAYRRKAELLAEAGVDLTVALPERWTENGRELVAPPPQDEPYGLVALPVVLPGSFHLHFYRGFGQLLAEAAPEVVLVDEEPYNLATAAAVRQARGAGTKTLFFTWQNLERRYPPPFSWLYRWVRGAVDGAIAGTATAAGVLRHAGYRRPLWVLPQFGVARSLLEAPAPAAPGAEPDRTLVVGYAGRWVDAKGIDVLVEAMARVRGSWQLRLAGAGAAEGSLRALAARLGVADRVSFEGWRGSLDIGEFYRGLHIFVLPSRATARWEEQFGRALAEAMACGVPCVGARTGEIPAVLGDAGRTFPGGDAAALARQIEELAVDGALWRRLSDAGRKRVAERFTMASVAQGTAAVFSDVVRGTHLADPLRFEALAGVP